MARVDIDESGLEELLAGPVAADLERRAERVLAAQVAKCPVDTGRLRGSLDIQKLVAPGGSPVVRIGSNVHYACVLGARASVVTDKGTRTIGQLRPGERVLTQTGEFRTVVAASRFPADEKPDMIEIRVPWRSGADHLLNLTVDHRVLVDREGRNKWVEAGDLLATDRVFVRRKAAHNRGSGGREHTCGACGERFRRAGSARRVYCSPTCRDRAWATGANPHLGAVRTAATRELLRQQTIARLAEHPELHPNRILARRGHTTTYEAAAAEWLQALSLIHI